MISTSYRLRNYDQFPVLSHQEIQQLIERGEQLIAYDELILSLKNFNHPGNSQILQPYINNLHLDAKDQFQKHLHSDYARLIISVRTVGKLQDKKNQSVASQSSKTFPNQGKALIQKVYQSYEFRLHQKTIQKIDFQKPIWTQINQLNLEEKEVLMEVPTFIQTQKEVMFKQSQWEEFKYTSNFWRSTLTFQAAIFVTLVYLFTQKEAEISPLHLFPFFVFGVAKWTLIEYYFHRFLLHYDLSNNPILSHHMMHHVFPQIKKKIAISVYMVVSYIVGFYLFYSMFLEKFQIISLLLGVLVGLTMYDIAHYYFHFGPETNIGWINKLKKNHLKHHYRDSSKGFGVSTTFWDSLFKTAHMKRPKLYR